MVYGKEIIYDYASTLYSDLDKLVDIQKRVKALSGLGLTAPLLSIALRTTLFTEFEKSRLKDSRINLRDFFTYEWITEFLDDMIRAKTNVDVGTNLDELYDMAVLKSKIRKVALSAIVAEAAIESMEIEVGDSLCEIHRDDVFEAKEFNAHVRINDYAFFNEETISKDHGFFRVKILKVDDLKSHDNGLVQIELIAEGGNSQKIENLDKVKLHKVGTKIGEALLSRGIITNTSNIQNLPSSVSETSMILWNAMKNEVLKSSDGVITSAE